MNDNVQNYKISEELVELHNEMLILLKAFHKFCIDHELKYSLHGGTLLGAVREQGFIPWDDDIDVSMTREQYNRLLAVVKDQGLPLGMTLMDDRRITKIVMQNAKKPLVWIDIFVWDYISENRVIQKLKLLGVKFFMVFVRDVRSLSLTRKNGVYKGMAFVLMAIVSCMGAAFSQKEKLRLANRFYASMGGKHTLIHRANDQLCGIGLIMPTSCMESFCLMRFEDTELMVTTEYAALLENTYGPDYMIPKRENYDARVVFEEDHKNTRNTIQKTDV